MGKKCKGGEIETTLKGLYCPQTISENVFRSDENIGYS
jgi:hypothetical protein